MKTNKEKKRIGELLIEADLVNEKQIREALGIQAKQGGKIVEILISLGYIDAPTFTRFLSKASRAPSIQIGNYEITREIISLIPREFALKHEVFPIDKLSNLLTLGMACPLDSKSIEELEKSTGLKVKPVLCAAADVRAAIQRYYGDPGRLEESIEPTPQQVAQLESPLRLSGIAALIRSITTLPALSKTVNSVREAMLDSSRSVREVANVIAQDPGMAAKILSVANSAAYGFRSRVNEITLAVSLMGLNDVYGTVLATAVGDTLGKKSHFDFQRFSADSLCCGAAARAIALAARKGHVSGVFSAGLLHDIGRLALAEAAPGHYAKIAPTLKGTDLIAAEEDLMGIAHPEAGYELSRHWDLPDEISEPIRYHHYPELSEAAPETVPIVALAVIWNAAAEVGFEDEREVMMNSSELIQKVGLTVASAQSVLVWLKTFVPAKLRPEPA